MLDGEMRVEHRAERQQAISENQSLSTLLEQARDEHPLRDLEEIKGSVWDVHAKVDT